MSTRIRVGRLRNLGSIHERGKNCFPLLDVQTGYVAHSPPYTMGTCGCFAGGKTVRFGKLTTHFHLLLRLGIIEVYLHSPRASHGVTFNSLSSKINSFFFYSMEYFSVQPFIYLIWLFL
jgi:hypothetical protein